MDTNRFSAQARLARAFSWCVALAALSLPVALGSCGGDDPADTGDDPAVTCAADADCPTGFECRDENTCGPIDPSTGQCFGCDSDGDAECPSDGFCFNDCCVTPPQECDSVNDVCGGTCKCDLSLNACAIDGIPCDENGVPVTPIPPGEGSPCESDLDCVGLVCVGGECIAGSGAPCREDGDCPKNEICYPEGRCAPGTPSGETDGDTDGPVFEGPRVLANPDAIDFGAFAVGVETTRKVTLRNVGDQLLEISDVRFSGSTSKDVFRLRPDPVVTEPVRLDPGETLEFDVVYSPDDEIADQGIIFVISNESEVPYEIPMASQVKGEVDLAIVDPATPTAQLFPRADRPTLNLNFGITESGKVETQGLLFRNQGTGQAVLTLESFLVTKLGPNDDSSQFSVTAFKQSGQELKPGETLYLNNGDEVLVDVSYEPTRGGFHDAQIEILTNDNDVNNDGDVGDRLLLVGLTGGADIDPPFIVADPRPINFGQVDVGETATLTVQFTNQSDDLFLENVDFAFLSNEAVFGFGPTPTTFAPSAADSVQFFFTPPDEARFVNTLRITGDGMKKAPNGDSVLVETFVVDVPIEGRGGVARLQITPAPDDDNRIYLGKALPFGRSAPRSIFIRNTGSDTIAIQLIRKQPSNLAEIVLLDDNVYPVNLAPNEEMEVQAFVEPVDFVAYEATLEILYPGFLDDQTDVIVWGEGAPCDDGFYDVNSDPLDGCEYECTFVSADDAPDDEYKDLNCDGIDGNRETAIFLSSIGNDANPGTITLPVRSLAVALDLARSATPTARDIYVTGGAYSEVDTLGLVPGVGIYGGYSKDYLARKSRTEGESWDAVITGAATCAIAADIATPTVLDNFSLRASRNRAPGGASIALYARNSPALSLRNMRLVGGDGGAGQTGIDNTVNLGARGGNGQRGQDACNRDLLALGEECDLRAGGEGGDSVCGSNGGDGGNGGVQGGGRNGNIGFPPVGGNGGIGGGSPGRPGGNLFGITIPPTPAGSATGAGGTRGGVGGDGGDGPVGAGGTGFGSFVNGEYVPANGANGQAGTPGFGGGGGGGGGSGCCTLCLPFGGACACGIIPGFPVCGQDSGGGGGGGGAGGCGGPGGGGGQGGGASFSLVLVDSPITITKTELARGNGGAGGTGGPGGLGGQGGVQGPGGDGSDAAGSGANGGGGGNGGAGGQGGGGAGGPAVGIAVIGSDPVTDTLTFTGGAGGAAGVPGGATGQIGDIVKF